MTRWHFLRVGLVGVALLIVACVPEQVFRGGGPEVPREPYVAFSKSGGVAGIYERLVLVVGPEIGWPAANRGDVKVVVSKATMEEIIAELRKQVTFGVRSVAPKGVSDVIQYRLEVGDGEKREVATIHSPGGLWWEVATIERVEKMMWEIAAKNGGKRVE